MSKTAKQMIITAGLMFILVVLLIKNMKGSSIIKKSADFVRIQQRKAVTSFRGTNRNIDDEKIPVLQIQRLESLKEWGRDPFEYIETELEQGYRTSALRLKGVSLGKDKTGLAFINDSIVQVGDAIGGYIVVQIQADKVLLRKGNQSFYLTLPEE